jgi:hypothetical protein
LRFTFVVQVYTPTRDALADSVGADVEEEDVLLGVVLVELRVEPVEGWSNHRPLKGAGDHRRHRHL